MTDKTFEVGKAYSNKRCANTIDLITQDTSVYGVNTDNPARYTCISYFDHGYIEPDSLGDHDFENYEEIKVKDLKEGDKVLLRCGEVAVLSRCGYQEEFYVAVGRNGSSDWVRRDSGLSWQQNHKNDVIAILERAKPEFKLEAGEYYKNMSAIVRITGFDSDDKYPFKDQYNRQYLEDGTCDNGLDKYRLVKKVKVTEVE